MPYLIARRLVAMVAVSLGIASVATRPPRAAEAIPRVDAATRRALIERVATLLENNYVFADTGALYARTLRDDLRQKRFDSVSDAHELARQLTRRLGTVHDDGHLQIMGPDSASPLPPMEIDIPRGAYTVPDSIVLDSLPPALQAALRPRFEAERRVNHYFRKLEILPGNVGYLELDQIGMLAFAKRTADAAFSFLADCDALILDLRDNPGGVEGLNRYLVSHFVTPDRSVLLYSRYTRATGDTLQTWSATGPHATDLSGKPLFILIGAATGSAAENISFTLQGLGRATLVGERTAGAAHSSIQVGLPGGFRMNLPISRAFNPRTGRDWESTGVLPDVPCSPESALARAHSLAIDSLIARAADAKRRDELARARVLFRARNAGPAGATPPLNTADYEGQWGFRKIWSEGGKLWLQRQDDPRAPKLELLRAGPDEFLVERANRPLRFERDGSGHVVRMRLQTPMDTWEVVERKGN